MSRPLHLTLHAALLLAAAWLLTDNIRLRAALEVARAVPPLPAPSPAAVAPAPVPVVADTASAAQGAAAAQVAAPATSGSPAAASPSATPFTDAIRAVQAQQEQSVKTNPFASKP